MKLEGTILIVSLYVNICKQSNLGSAFYFASIEMLKLLQVVAFECQGSSREISFKMLGNSARML